jgi:hypothetical protein
MTESLRIDDRVYPLHSGPVIYGSKPWSRWITIEVVVEGRVPWDNLEHHLFEVIWAQGRITGRGILQALVTQPLLFNVSEVKFQVRKNSVFYVFKDSKGQVTSNAVQSS